MIYFSQFFLEIANGHFAMLYSLSLNIYSFSVLQVPAINSSKENRIEPISSGKLMEEAQFENPTHLQTINTRRNGPKISLN